MISATGRRLSFPRAITFIELLIVISIIAVLIGVSIPLARKTFSALQLRSLSRELQSFMNYLQERSIVEGKIIYLNVDNSTRQYWAQIRDQANRLKTYRIQGEIVIEADKNPVAFYPDGNSDKVTLKLSNPQNDSLILTNIGVFGGIKIQPQ
jgi:Tfp pilus assembly protein FimT